MSALLKHLTPETQDDFPSCNAAGTPVVVSLVGSGPANAPLHGPLQAIATQHPAIVVDIVSASRGELRIQQVDSEGNSVGINCGDLQEATTEPLGARVQRIRIASHYRTSFTPYDPCTAVTVRGQCRN